MYYLARARCYYHGMQREHKPGGRQGNASLLQLKRMSERWYSPRIFSRTDLVQQVSSSTEPESVKTKPCVYSVWQVCVACVSFRKKCRLNSNPYSSAPVTRPHPTKKHGQLQKTTCAQEIPYCLFQAKLSSPESSTAQAFAICKDSVPLNYSLHLVTISLPQSTATTFCPSLHGPSLEQIQNRENFY